jgi:hypothetical protein
MHGTFCNGPIMLNFRILKIQFVKWKQDFSFFTTKINFFLPITFEKSKKYKYYSDNLDIRHVQ